MSKRSYKLQEFVAHTSRVTCLEIGRMSSGLLVTGGDDRKVNVWAIGKRDVLLSLTGHQSPVDCVSFDSAEQVVAAGAQSGTVKIWDLHEAKVVRTLTGHRSNCQSVDFHPFGDYLATGSLDTNVKVWDLRGKDCIRTFKGHTKGINHLSFSPDGRWIASGSEDGTVKIWDMAAGKLIFDINQHTHPITGLEFHPNEFLLGTSSMDRSIKFWDLDTFELVDTAGPDALPARALRFTPDGTHMLAAQQDGLRVYSWEPAQQHDWVDAAWTKVADMSLHEGKLIGCSFNQTMVGVWVVDLARVKPFCTSAGARESKSGRTGGLPRPQANVTQAPEPHTLPSITSSGADQGLQSAAAAVVPGPRPSVATPSTSAPSETPSARTQHASTPTPACDPPKQMVSIGTAIGDSLPMGGLDMSALSVDGHCSGSRLRREAHDQGGGTSRSASSGPHFTIVAPDPPSASSQQRRATPDLDPASTSASASTSRMKSAPQHASASPAATSAPASAPAPLPVGPQPQGLDLEAFLPASIAPAVIEAADITDEETLAEMLGKHAKMQAIVSTRLSTLQVVKGFWAKGDVRGAIAALKRSKDMSAAADLLSTTIHERAAFKLDTIPEVSPLLFDLLKSGHERWQMVAIDNSSSLIRDFGQLIRDTLQAVSGIGTDLSMEDRRRRCEASRRALQKLVPWLTTLSQSGGEVGRKSQDLVGEIEAL